MAHDLTALRHGRALAVAASSTGVADKHLLDVLLGQGVDRATADIVVRQIEVDRATAFAINGRRDIHYGLLTAGSAAVIFLISLTLPILPIVFGTAVLVGLAWMARGFFFRWRAERIAPGIYKGAFRELFGGHAGDLIKNPDEVLTERAEIALSIKRARSTSLYFSYLMTGVMFSTLLFRMSALDDENAFFYVMALTFLTFFAALVGGAELLFRAENLPPPRPFRKATPVVTAEPAQRYSAPHFSQAPADNAVIFGEAHDKLPAQGAATKYKDDMVFGVLNFTQHGLVFLPDAPVDNAELRAMGRVAIDLAAGAHPALEALRDAVMEKIDVPETLPEWMRKALDHPSHFVIAWADLVETGYDPQTGETSLVKDNGSGVTQTYKLAGLGNGMAAYLFNLKLDYEEQKVIFELVWEQKYRQIAAELTPHFQKIYGETGNYAAELHKAVGLRMSSAPLDADQLAAIREKMAPLQPARDATPHIVFKEGQLRLATVEDYAPVPSQSGEKAKPADA